MGQAFHRLSLSTTVSHDTIIRNDKMYFGSQWKTAEADADMCLLDRQPTGDVNQKPSIRMPTLPLHSTRPVVIAITDFTAWLLQSDRYQTCAH